MQLGLSPAGDLWPSVESSLPEEPRVLGDSAAMLSSGLWSTMGVLAMATETTAPVIHFTTPTPDIPLRGQRQPVTSAPGAHIMLPPPQSWGMGVGKLFESSSRQIPPLPSKSLSSGCWNWCELADGVPLFLTQNSGMSRW